MSRRSKLDPTGTPFEESDTIDVLSLFKALRRRIWLIAAITLIGTGIATWYGKSLTPIYTAESSVLIEPANDQVLDIEAVTSSLTADSPTIATQIRILQSRTYQARIMEDLGLFDDPDFNDTLAAAEDEAAGSTPGPFDDGPLAFLAGPLETVLSLVPDKWLIGRGVADESAPVLETEAPFLVRERTLNNFQGVVQIFNDPASYIITIAVGLPDREKAARIANRIAEIYVDDQLNNKIFATDRASGWLEERLEQLRQEVNAAEQAVAEFRSTNLVGVGGVTLNQQELSDLNRELIVTRAEQAERQAKLRLVRELRSSGQGLDSIADVVNSPLILSLRQQEAQLLREEAELSTLYGDRHPRMVHLQTEKRNLQAKIVAEIDRIIQTLENDTRVTATRIATIEAQLGQVKSQSATDQAAEVRLAELERQAEASRGLYEAFLQRFKETREQLEIIQPDVRIISIASPPTQPSTPGTKIFAAAGFAVSFGVASLLAIALERLDRGLRSARQLEQRFDLTTLGFVPRLDKLKKNQKPYQYLMEKPLSAFAEAIRRIYMGVKLSNVDREPKVVLVTSSLPQEGKTTFAVALATFAARSNKRVLLLDLDLRHPSVHRELGWQVAAGLVEYMANERTLEEVIHHDLETGLHFLPIKGQTTNPTDLLDSQKMRLLIESLRDSYDYIVLDSAPLASVTDTRVAALLADKVLFCVLWGQNMIGAVEDSLQALKEVGIEPAGAVLSQIDLKRHAQYGYGDVGQYYSKSQKYYVN